MLLSLLIVAITAALNRVRGAKHDYVPFLPGRAILWVTAVVAGLAFIVHGAWAAAAFAAGYLFWGLWPWGHLQVLGRLTAEQIGRPPSELEALLLKLARGNIHVALGLRHLFVLPGLAAAAWFGAPLYLVALAPVFAVLTVVAYEAMWRVSPSNPIWLAEIITGALWGALLVL
jgi:hypothetical protein